MLPFTHGNQGRHCLCNLLVGRLAEGDCPSAVNTSAIQEKMAPRIARTAPIPYGDWFNPICQILKPKGLLRVPSARSGGHLTIEEPCDSARSTLRSVERHQSQRAVQPGAAVETAAMQRQGWRRGLLVLPRNAGPSFHHARQGFPDLIAKVVQNGCLVVYVSR